MQNVNKARTMQAVLVPSFLLHCVILSHHSLSARKPILLGNMGFEPGMLDQMAGNSEISSEKLCDLMFLQRKQRKICRREKGVSDTLVEATRLSSGECIQQFKNERWNCSLGEQYRLNILRRGFKETSFLYAISSASLVHTFARACSRGIIDRCTCDESKNMQQNREAWLWGGCGDNIKFGLKFSRRFLRAGKRRGKDIRAKVDQHNIRLGRKVVKSEVSTRCKCHGISGSCTTRTCWRQLTPFPTIGTILKQKYEHSYREEVNTNIARGKYQLPDDVSNKNEASTYVTSSKARNFVSSNALRKKTKKSLRNKVKEIPNGSILSSRTDIMVHLEDSPTFCEPSHYSPGTKGRVCDSTNCEVMCCGRGYNIRSVTVRRACQCQVHWCCYVECKQCISQEEVHLCK